MAVSGKQPIRTKLFFKYTSIAQVIVFNYLRVYISNGSIKDINRKKNVFEHICGTIKKN